MGDTVPCQSGSVLEKQQSSAAKHGVSVVKENRLVLAFKQAVLDMVIHGTTT